MKGGERELIRLHWKDSPYGIGITQLDEELRVYHGYCGGLIYDAAAATDGSAHWQCGTCEHIFEARADILDQHWPYYRLYGKDPAGSTVEEWIEAWTGLRVTVEVED